MSNLKIEVGVYIKLLNTFVNLFLTFKKPFCCALF
jgi:hypothetical protein